MSQSDLTLGADDSLDDLPRTLRREHEARGKAAQTGATDTDFGVHGSEAIAKPATVIALDIPFVHLMFFFIKAVLAAIPALLLLGALLWLAGEVLQAYFPWLLKVKVLIHVPQ